MKIQTLVPRDLDPEVRDFPGFRRAINVLGVILEMKHPKIAPLLRTASHLRNVVAEKEEDQTIVSRVSFFQAGEELPADLKFPFAYDGHLFVPVLDFRCGRIYTTPPDNRVLVPV